MRIIPPKKASRVSNVLLTLLLLIAAPVFVIVILLYFLWGAFLYLAIWLTKRKPFVLFVYSDSPIWKDYIEREIVPHLQDRAMILNWSERRRWKNSLAVLAFRYFGGQRNFNPIGIVARPLQRAKTYRFFEAFQEFKHGKSEKVEQIKNELFEALGV